MTRLNLGFIVVVFQHLLVLSYDKGIWKEIKTRPINFALDHD